MEEAKRKRGRQPKALEFAGDHDTGEIVVVPREAVTFLSMTRDSGGYRVHELKVDLSTNTILENIAHEPTLKAIAEDLFKIEVVKKIWAKTD